jgi:hypothetical protein
MRKLFFLLLPDYPEITHSTKHIVITDSIIFIKNILAKQPLYISYPILIIIYFLNLISFIFGARILFLLFKLYPLSKVFVFLSSLISIIFYENNTILTLVNEKTATDRVMFYKKKYKALNEKN